LNACVPSLRALAFHQQRGTYSSLYLVDTPIQFWWWRRRITFLETGCQEAWFGR
jgi:hypothetical protein